VAVLVSQFVMGSEKGQNKPPKPNSWRVKGRGGGGGGGGVGLGRFILSLLASHDKLCQNRHFTSVLAKSQVPDSWKHGQITPHHKKESVLDKKNFRFIYIYSN